MQRDGPPHPTILGIHRDVWPVVLGAVVGGVILGVTGLGCVAAALLGLVEVLTTRSSLATAISSVVLALLGAGTLYAVFVIGNVPKWYRDSTRALLGENRRSVYLELLHDADSNDQEAAVCVREGATGPVLFERVEVVLPENSKAADWPRGVATEAELHALQEETTPRVFTTARGLLWVRS